MEPNLIQKIAMAVIYVPFLILVIDQLLRKIKR